MSTLERNPKISIIIACYNGKSYINECIDSIIKQTYKNLEIICVNDGSKDNTLEILNLYKDLDQRVVVIDQSNKGLSETRNVGVRHATGNYIIFVDNDDWISTDMIEETFTKESNADLYCCSYNRIFKNKKIPRVLNLSGAYNADIILRRLVGLTDKELADPTQADSLVTAWGKIYKSDIIKSHNIIFLDAKIIGTEDAFFNIQYLNYCKSVYIIDKPFYQYRKYNETSLTSNHNKGLLDKWKSLYNLIREEIKGKDESFQIALNNRISLGLLGVSLNELLSKVSLIQKYKNIRDILQDPLYVHSFENFEIGNMPTHWKLFYWSGKKKMSTFVFALALVINWIQKRKNF